MILKRKKLLTVFTLIIFLCSTKISKAQPSPSIAINLNEYCTSNIMDPDNFGVLSDWVEISNVHTSSVSLNGYYLSNDRNNLKKWAFPSSFTLAKGGLGIVWLSGKNGVYNGNFHANFTLDQCKKQWLILSTSAGAIRDSVFIQPTKAGHSRGRVTYNTLGIKAWKLFTTSSKLIPNPLTNNFLEYMPKPSLVPMNPTGPISTGNATSNTGFFAIEPQQLKFKINGTTYDTINFPCYAIYYTTNGDYPIPDYSGLNPNSKTKLYVDSATPNPINIDATTLVRAIVVARTYTSPASPVPTLACNTMTDYLESFCESNTYFIGTDHNTFKDEFGVVSIAMDWRDTTWFSAQGNPPSTTIHVEYYDKKKHLTEGYGTINRPINETWATKQKGYYISIDDKNGFGCNFEAPIFNLDSLGSSQRKVFPTLHLYGGDIESNSSGLTYTTNTSFGTGLRDVFLQTLATKYKLNVNPMHYKPVVTFINGKYMGMWNFKEVYDKYYEEYYNNQAKDSVDMCFYHNGEGNLSYTDGSNSNYNSVFKTSVYDKANVASLKGPTNPNYVALFNGLDKSSLIDYMVLQSFFMNSDLWNYNIAFAKGNRPGKGNKYHYYLWNTPAILNFTNVATNTMVINNIQQTPCVFDQVNYPVSLRAYNAPGLIHTKLMNGITGNDGYKLEYKNRYQDLLNSALKCENLVSHYKYVYGLYRKEMRCHEDPACAAGITPFNTLPDLWDTNIVRMSFKLLVRCDFIAGTFTNNTNACYGITGPNALTVRVEPEGAGNVKINTLTPDAYPWTGKYYATLMNFKATPTNTNVYVFHHWKLQNHTPVDPISKDSIGVNLYTFEDITAVFTDKTRDITNSGESPNVPTGFSPNGDNLNDFFKPLGSAEYVTNYEFTIWNRWGQRVYVSHDPHDAGWDGNYQGQQSVTGVYAYIIVYKNAFGEDKILKGNVTLTR